MNNSYSKMTNLCAEVINELGDLIIFAAENLGKAEVDSHVLLKLIQDTNEKIKVINQEYQLEVAKDIAKLVGEIDELKTSLRRRTKSKDTTGRGSGTEGMEGDQ